jgi:hypothetical protein
VDRETFAKGMAFLQGAVQVSAGTETLNAYWHLLRDLDADLFRSAVVAAAASHKYHTLPPVAEIRRHADQISAGIGLTWEESLSAVVKVISRAGGQYASPEDRRAAIETLPEQVRPMAARWWMTLCRSEDASSLRNQWRMAWEAEQSRAKEVATLPPAVRPKMPDLGRLFHMPKGIE